MRVPRLLREPLLHFVALGALVLGGARLMGVGEQHEARNTIIVDDARLQQITERWETTHGREPSAEELSAEVEVWVRESVLVREAERLRLGADDPVVRAHLAEQMAFLLAAWEVPPEPDEQTLRDAWEQWHDEFRQAERVTLRQWALADDASEYEARTHAARARLEAGEVPDDAGEMPPGGPILRGRRPERLAEQRGQLFAERARTAGVGEVFRVDDAGMTVLVRVEDRTPGGVIPFERARGRVLARWQALQVAAAREAAFEALRDDYDVQGWPR